MNRRGFLGLFAAAPLIATLQPVRPGPPAYIPTGVSGIPVRRMTTVEMDKIERQLEKVFGHQLPDNFILWWPL